MNGTWPELAFAGWRDTCLTLHRWAQIVGKVTLACTVRQNHWWNVGLHLTASGLRTPPLAAPDGRTFDLAFDFLEHELLIRTNGGGRSTIELGPFSVASFYDQLFTSLEALGLDVTINPNPVEIPTEALPLNTDEQHHSYDPKAVRRFFLALCSMRPTFEAFSARFTGKQSPLLFWWGTFDLSLNRYSGRPAPPRPNADVIIRESYTHEVSSVGFWAGDDGFPEPAFFAYAAPPPEGYAVSHVEPGDAFFDAERGLFLLRYEDVRRSLSPEGTVLSFFQSTYEAAADAAEWDREGLERHDRIGRISGAEPGLPMVH